MPHLRSATIRVLLTASLICAATHAIADGALPRGRAATGRGFPAVFGAGEVPGASLTPFKRWTAVLERVVHETPAYDEPCALRFRGRCIAAEWRQLIRTLDGRARRERIDAVNAFFNRMPYVLDPGNWGASDYWASPLQFLARAGDCEDYAIAKYFALIAAGVPSAKLRMVYVRIDLDGRVTPHMVLAYYAQPQAEPLVLDNLRGEIEPASARRDLRAVFSFNGEGLWEGTGGGRAGDPAARLSRWREVLAKARAEGFV